MGITTARFEETPAQSSELVEVPISYHLKHPSTPHLKSLDEYLLLYRKSIESPDAFWSAMATASLKWETPFERVQHGSLETGDHAWFIGAKLNACYNCVDRHALASPDKVAMLYERDTPGDQPDKVTFGELLRDVSRLSWVLRDMDVRKGDIVTIYMPNVPEAVVAMLACARIGAVHSVIFAGFSAPSLRGRLEDARSKVVLTVDEHVRGGKTIPMKSTVDDALSGYDNNQVRCLVLRKTGNPIPWCERSSDLWWHEECSKWPGYYEPVPVGAEHPLYMLYTSGSTGKPKGLLHTTAGYLLGSAVSGKYVLDLHPSDIMFCSGDVGWITGHNYVVYTPLVLGVTTVIFEGTPSFPEYNRFWQILDRTKATHFYTAPTALRMVKKARPNGNAMSMERLRIIASIGEPLAPNVWQWCFEVLGQKDVHVLDTYFQTETGYHAFSPLAGITPAKPGSVALPFFGFNPILIDPASGREVEGDSTTGVLTFKQPWPSIARTVWGDHSRYMKTYFEVYKGYFMTGDSAVRDPDGYYRILGRVDDVVNVSGHRLSTGEIEAALLNHGAFAEVAVVGSPDERTGQALNVFACRKEQGDFDQASLRSSAIQHVGNTIGRFSIPKQVFFVSDLPKTRSGKIMRRLLKKVLEGERTELGDTSTLLRPGIMADVIEELANQGNTPQAPSTGNTSVPNQPSVNIPYPFKSYNLTALDHILPPCHMFMFLTLDNASLEGIDVLKDGAQRLSQHFPFLTGVVAPSSQAAGKEGVFEVQPASSSFMQRYPMIQIGYAPEMDDISPDDFIQQQYLPIPFLMAATEPLPLIRFKANVTKNRIILCVVYYHRALDSTSVSVCLKALAELCKNSEASPDLLPSSVSSEESSRHHLANPKAGNPLPLNWTLAPLSLDPKLPDDPGKIPTSRRFGLSFEKVSLLKDTCNAVLAALPPIDGLAKPPLLTSNDILTALAGLCGNKARLETVPEHVPSPKVIIAANVRKQCRLPETYMGNALVAVEPPYDTSSFPKAAVPPGLPGALNKQLACLYNMALSLRRQVSSLTEDYMQGILRTIAESHDLSTCFPDYGNSIIVSNLRWMDFFLDFGPLGKVLRYDIPENKVPGVCWVLPAWSSSDPFEIRFVLEKVAMERLQEDSLFQWMLTA